MVGEPAEIDVVELEITDENAGHLARHGVTRENVLDVLRQAPRFFHNLADRGGSHVMIGPDSTGRFFYIAIRPTITQGRWRPVTGWPMNRRGAMQIYESGRPANDA